MARRRTRPADAVLMRQKAAADRLRRELLGADGSLTYPYFRDLRRQLRRGATPCDREQLFEACRRADVVYVGDFHAVRQCQQFAADLLETLAAEGSGTALGVEFIYTRQQRLLDRRQSGLIDDPTFLRRIHYREEWGYPWSGFARLLDRARAVGARVYALDSPPRGGFGGLRRRDDHAAQRVAGILAAGSVRRLLVLYGESHVSSSHIPKKVQAQLRRRGHEVASVTVFQDPDEIYWKLVSRAEPVPKTVRLDERTYAVFHGNPLAKYEAYRQVLERWREDVPPEEEVDLTPAVHHLLAVLLGYLGIRASRLRLHSGEGWSEYLADAYPEVYSGPEAAELLEPILRENRRTPQELAEARQRLAWRGALYEPRSNSLFLSRYLPGRAAGEGARFLRAALSGRLFDPSRAVWADSAARAYGAAYDEGLAMLGSQLVDPTENWSGHHQESGAEADRRPADLRWLQAHAAFEARSGLRPPEKLTLALRRSRRLRRALAVELGRRLGSAWFQRVRSGQIDARQLRFLFRRKLNQNSSRRIVLQSLRGTDR